MEPLFLQTVSLSFYPSTEMNHHHRFLFSGLLGVTCCVVLFQPILPAPFGSETVRSFVRSRCNGGGLFYQNKGPPSSPRDDHEGCAVWVYEGALVDPSNGRTIAQVEGLEIARHLTECYNSARPKGNETFPDDSSQLQAWATFRGLKRLGDLKVKDTLSLADTNSNHSNHWDYATTILSRKLFCYMAPPDDSASRQLLARFRMRPTSPVRNIPLQQATALYDTATTFISCNQGRDMYVLTEFPDGKWFMGAASGQGGGNNNKFDFQIYARASTPKDKPALSLYHHDHTGSLSTTHTVNRIANNILHKLQLPWTKTEESTSSSTPILISPPRSKFMQFGKDSFVDQLKRYGSSRETYAYTMEYPENHRIPLQLLPRVKRSIESWMHFIDRRIIHPIGQQIGLWDDTYPILSHYNQRTKAPNNELKNSPAPLCSLRYTRFGESPPWYGIGRMCVLELNGHKISSLNEIPPLVARIAATQVPGGFMSVHAPIPNAPIVIEALSKTTVGTYKTETLSSTNIQQQMKADEGAVRAISWFRGQEPGSIPLRIVEPSESFAFVHPTFYTSFVPTKMNTKSSTSSTSSVDDATEWLPESDLTLANRNIHIFTTAALPWRTGTSINALLRALYIIKDKLKHGDEGEVHLVLPWLDGTRSAAHRVKLYGPGVIKLNGTDGQQQQSNWIRHYASHVCGMHDEAASLRITYYEAIYWEPLGSIFPIVDLCSQIPPHLADVAILEEPEHLNWFQIPDPAAHAHLTNHTPLPLDKLAWKLTFRFVIGVIHTNYSAYMKQYGLGSSFFTAPVLDAVSALVVRAYCHKIIRLSDSVPTFASHKEICCNVHGVRNAFFTPSQATAPILQVDDTQKVAPIYFVGKLLWAKGFDKMLHIQDEYRKDYGHYFPIDIYGSGPDDSAIQRAFFGRRPKDMVSHSHQEMYQQQEQDPPINVAPSIFVREVLQNSCSLRSQLIKMTHNRSSPSSHSKLDPFYDEVMHSIHQGLEVTCCCREETHAPSSFLSITQDVSRCVVETGLETSKAMAQVSNMALTELKQMTLSTDLKFDPPQSLFEFRKHPIPARFLGVKDHAALSGIICSKIFLNPSITEVLCTTTAEALAMNKFCVIPHHPSNEFFYSFSNCLSYRSMKECVEKIRFALDHEPEPLNDEEKNVLSWEAATIRFYHACKISRHEYESDDMKNKLEEDEKMVWLHNEGMKKGQFLHNLFHKIMT